MSRFEFYSKLYDSVLDPIVVVNNNKSVLYANEAFCTMFSISQVRVMNQKVRSDKIHGVIIDSQMPVFSYIESLSTFENSEILKFETKKNHETTVQLKCEPNTDPDGNNELIICMRDLTAEEQLLIYSQKEISSRNQKIFEMNQLLDIMQRVRLIEKPRPIVDEYISFFQSENKNFDIYLYDQKNISKKYGKQNIKEAVDQIFENSQPEKNELFQFLSQNYLTKYKTIKLGEKLYALSPFTTNQEHFVVIFAFENVTALESFNHQLAIILNDQMNTLLNNQSLKEISNTDGLTKIKNNLYFRKKIEQDCSTTTDLQLVLFDVDFFKKINDNYGHPGGDAVLIYLGEVLNNISKDDVNFAADDITCARVGGEEFAIILKNKDVTFAEYFCNTLRKQIESNEISYLDHKIKFTISMGIASWSLQEDGYNEANVKKLYKSADDALYYSKKNGRNQVTVFSQMAAKSAA